MKPIVLTGMMGSGKTTIAKLLAQKLGFESVDIDSLIEEKEKLSISEIFNLKGEIHFRNIEKETIFSIFPNNNIIISLGGGAFEAPATREFLLKNATVIFLEASPDTIFERIKNNTSRPLLCDKMNKEKISEILEKRKQNYNSAHLKITTDNKTPNTVVEEITGVIKNDKFIRKY